MHQLHGQATSTVDKAFPCVAMPLRECESMLSSRYTCSTLSNLVLVQRASVHSAP